MSSGCNAAGVFPTCGTTEFLSGGGSMDDFRMQGVRNGDPRPPLATGRKIKASSARKIAKPLNRRGSLFLGQVFPTETARGCLSNPRERTYIRIPTQITAEVAAGQRAMAKTVSSGLAQGELAAM